MKDRNIDQTRRGAKPYSKTKLSVTSKAFWFIESHLGEELSLQTIADAVGVSRFHLCRAFAVTSGDSLAGYVRARRLSEAAKRLLDEAPEILPVALNAGYNSHEAFTRAFRQHFGLTPEQVRAQAQPNNLNLQEPIRMDQPVKTPLASPRIERGRALRIFGISQECDSQSKAGIPLQWSKFVPHIGHILNQVGNLAYGVVYRHSDDSAAYEYLCGVEVSAFPAYPADFARLQIPGQTYAVFQHQGHISEIADAWRSVWEHGLSDGGFQAADGPAFERYGETFDGHTGMGTVELWVPVKE